MRGRLPSVAGSYFRFRIWTEFRAILHTLSLNSTLPSHACGICIYTPNSENRNFCSPLFAPLLLLCSTILLPRSPLLCSSLLYFRTMAGASPRASASVHPDALLAVTDDKMDISEVGITPIEASVAPRRVRFPRDGKNCHQCRQTITDRVASCTNIKGKRRCRVNICRRCLHNRYAEDVDVVFNLTEWSCPKCRNICNCSLCRRKMGCDPTGILAPMAKENGFSSVHQFIASGKELPKRKYGELSSSCIPNYNTNNNNARKKLRVEGGNGKVIEDNSGLNSQSTEEPKEDNRAIGSTEISDENENAALVSQPQEKNIVEIGGEDYTSEDMGAALLFLECVMHFTRGQSYQKENMENQAVIVYLITTQMITALGRNSELKVVIAKSSRIIVVSTTNQQKNQKKRIEQLAVQKLVM